MSSKKEDRNGSTIKGVLLTVIVVLAIIGAFAIYNFIFR